MNKYFKRAFFLAKKGKGKVKTNPLVGCVLVKDDKIISEGYHSIFGGDHAERMALKEDLDFSGATLYVTLEPCNHWGKTPPCTEVIIEKKITKVVIGSLDPNPLVSGQGVKRLREAGIKVNFASEKVRKKNEKLNEAFFYSVKEKKPWVILKGGMSLDGKIRDAFGNSKWITSKKARTHSHKLRSRVDAIMVGINTVLEDNPRLTTREVTGNNPLPIIVDSKLRIPLDALVLKEPCIILTSEDHCEKKREALEKKAKVLVFGKKKVDLEKALEALYEENIGNVLLEGGSTLHEAMLRGKLVNEIQLYIAPKILGGKESLSLIEGVGFPLESPITIKNLHLETIGKEVLLKGHVHRNC